MRAFAARQGIDDAHETEGCIGMWKSVIVGLFAAWTATVCVAADLTEVESRWLQGAWPVVTFAKAADLPLDIVVQPQPSPGKAPLALAFVDGRCKLVLSMRGNPEAQATLDRIEPELLDAALELMAAHELGHCRRYLDGAWLGVPAGFSPSEPAGLSAPVREAYLAMQAQRREEGYADLVGLAWARKQHPQLYARLQAWMLAERTRDRVEGSQHDTVAWVRLAGDAGGPVGGSIFEAALTLWQRGLERVAAGE
jgi:hypothetical protein